MFYFHGFIFFGKQEHSGKWSDILFNIIPNANLVSLLVFMYILSIRVVVLCVILVGFVIVGKKPALGKGPSIQRHVLDFYIWGNRNFDRFPTECLSEYVGVYLKLFHSN